MEKLKLFVWTGLSYYGSQMMHIALAESEEEARHLIAEEFTKDSSNDADAERIASQIADGELEVYEDKVGLYVFLD